jgi:hypothetical protein
MKFLRRLFQIPPEPRSAFRILLWWELRRCVYLPFLAIVGFIAVALMAFAARNPPPGDEGFEPLLLVMFSFFGANVCYTGGWIAELVARRMWKDKVTYFGPVAFSLGLIFTALVCIPVPLLFALCSF